MITLPTNQEVKPRYSSESMSTYKQHNTATA